MWFGIITLFPELFSVLQHGIIGRALEKKSIEFTFYNPRDYTQDKHQVVDDHPYGGGSGMVLKPDPLIAAIKHAKQLAKTPTKVIYLSPQGKIFNQRMAIDLASLKSLLLVSGRYEGIDQRVINLEIDEELSIGDYILAGGELPAMVVIEAVARLLPNVVGKQESVTEDSLMTGLLKYPQYTRPKEYLQNKVPDILLSGNHAAIHAWRLRQSLGKTWLKRPELLAKKQLSAEEKTLLNDFIREYLTK